MRVISCEFNMDTACVDLRPTDGTLISIDCTAVENEVADNMYQRSEPDWLIYNAPLGYVGLILYDDPETYLKAVTVCINHLKSNYSAACGNFRGRSSFIYN
ncbi:MAG: DUF6061 family protein [Oscillospiraceae bacterium]